MKRSIFLLIFFLSVGTQEIVAQCSQCKLLAEQGGGLDEKSFANNINGGILYLMLVPYLILLFLFRKPVFNFLKGLFSAKA